MIFFLMFNDLIIFFVLIILNLYLIFLMFDNDLIYLAFMDIDHYTYFLLFINIIRIYENGLLYFDIFFDFLSAIQFTFVNLYMSLLILYIVYYF
jgi:hypothetical protein